MSKDRAPFCPDAAWLAIDHQSCTDHGYTQIVFSSSSEAAQLRFRLVEGLSCVKFEISVVAPGTACDGLALSFNSGVKFTSVGNDFAVDGLLASTHNMLPYC